MKQEIFTIKKIESLSPLSQILSHVLIYSWSLSRENCRVFKLIWFGEVLLQFLNHFCGSLVLIEAIDFKNTQKGSQQCIVILEGKVIFTQLQRKPRKRGFNRTSSDCFLVFLCNCLSCFTTAKITVTSILYLQCIYMIYISYTHHLGV